MIHNSRIRHRFDLSGKVALLTGASKGIGEAMARGMAEFGATVVVSSRVNAICPGLIRTRFSEALWSNDEILDRFLQHTPLGRAGEPDDVAGLACFLASDSAAYCSGGVYSVDGGYLAN